MSAPQPCIATAFTWRTGDTEPDNMAAHITNGRSRVIIGEADLIPIAKVLLQRAESAGLLESQEDE